MRTEAGRLRSAAIRAAAIPVATVLGLLLLTRCSPADEYNHDVEPAVIDTTSLSLVQLIAVPREFADHNFVQVDGLCFTTPADRAGLYLSRADHAEGNHRSSLGLRGLDSAELHLCTGQWVRAVGQVREVEKGLGVLDNVHIVPRPSGVVPSGVAQ